MVAPIADLRSRCFRVTKPRCWFITGSLKLNDFFFVSLFLQVVKSISSRSIERNTSWLIIQERNRIKEKLEKFEFLIKRLIRKVKGGRNSYD